MILLPLLIADILINLAIWSKVNHTREATIRGILLVIITVFDRQTVLLWGMYMVLYEFGLNIGRRLPLFRIGETAWADRMQRKYPQLIGVKYALAVGGVILYLIL